MIQKETLGAYSERREIEGRVKSEVEGLADNFSGSLSSIMNAFSLHCILTASFFI